MADDMTKKPEQPDKKAGAADKVDELPQKPITDRDADSVKGGVGATKKGG